MAAAFGRGRKLSGRGKWRRSSKPCHHFVRDSIELEQVLEKSHTQQPGLQQLNATRRLLIMGRDGATMQVHRCAFVDWTPSAVQAIAARPRATPDEPRRVAVVREDGSIEFWNADRKWFMHAVRAGVRECAYGVTLAWACA